MQPVRSFTKQAEYQRRYYLKNRERIVAKKREARAKNPEANRAACRKWYSKNKDIKAIKFKRWYDQFGAEYRAYKRAQKGK